MGGFADRADSGYVRAVARAPVVLTFEPCARGSTHVKLTDAPPWCMAHAVREKLHVLAVAGFLAEKIEGDCAGDPPRMTITYTATALGRHAVGIRAEAPRPVHRQPRFTDAELIKDAVL